MQDNADKELLKKVFNGNLSESEINIIPKLELGQCILSIDGQTNISMQVQLSEEEKMIFKGGV